MRTQFSPRAAGVEHATTLMPAQGLGELPTLYSLGWMRAYAPLVYLASRLRDEDCVQVDPATLRRELRARIAEARLRADAAGLRREDIQDAELAMVAMLDSAALGRPGPLKAAWTGHTLEFELYQSNLSGHTFFTTLDRLLKAQNLALVELYLWVLRTGFQGEQADPVEYRQRAERLLGGRASKVQLWDGRGVELPPPPPPPRGPSPWAMLLAGGGFVFALTAIVLIAILAQSRSLGADLRALSVIVEQSVER